MGAKYMSISQAETIPGYVTGTWTIDPLHSEVGFSVRHMMVSKVRGKFTKFSGELVTGESPLASSVTAEIDLASIDTGAEQRDGHLRSPDFFDTENHPAMSYRSTGIRAKGDGYVVDGYGRDQPSGLRRDLERRYGARRRGRV